MVFFTRKSFVFVNISALSIRWPLRPRTGKLPTESASPRTRPTVSRTAHAAGCSVGTLMGSVIRPGLSEHHVPAQRALPVLCAWGNAPDQIEMMLSGP